MDRGTLLRDWLLLVVGLPCIGFVVATAPGPRDLTRWIGIILTLVGFGGVTLARFTLGRSFSVMAKATELVTTGIYSRIRNPIYVSSVIVFAGFWLIVRQPLFGLFLFILVPMQIVRARREARVLEAKFGDDYRHYRASTWF